MQVGGVTLQAAGRTFAAVSSSGSRGHRTPPCPSAASQEHTTIFTACSNIHDIVVVVDRAFSRLLHIFHRQSTRQTRLTNPAVHMRAAG